MIHNSSIIDKDAKIGQNVKIGPFCYIGRNVQIDNDVNLISNIHIEGNTKIGKGTKIFPFASIGTEPQDLKYKGELNSIEIGIYSVMNGVLVIRKISPKDGEYVCEVLPGDRSAQLNRHAVLVTSLV